MPTFDGHKNFAYSTVATAPSPATSGTSLVVQTGDGSKFAFGAPAAPVLSQAASGGSVAAGTYTLAITYVTPFGETVASATATITTSGTTSTITVATPPWKSVGALQVTGYNVYCSQAGGATLTRQNATAIAIGTSLTISAPPTTSGAAPPTTDTALQAEITLWPANTQPTTANAEIGRVTGVATDTLTITRNQEGTTAQSVATGWQVAITETALMLQNIEQLLAFGGMFLNTIGVPPVAPTVTTTSPGTGATYAYAITAMGQTDGETTRSPVSASVTNGATLSSTSYNTITVPSGAVVPLAKGYAIYRYTASGASGNSSQIGRIGTLTAAQVAAGTGFQDTGLAATGANSSDQTPHCDASMGMTFGSGPNGGNFRGQINLRGSGYYSASGNGIHFDYPQGNPGNYADIYLTNGGNINLDVNDPYGNLGRVSIGPTYTTITSPVFGSMNNFGNTIQAGVNVKFPITVKTAAYTVGQADRVILVDASGGPITISLPSIASGYDGAFYEFKKIDSTANAVTITANGTQTIEGVASVSLSAQYASSRLCASNAKLTWYKF